MHTQQSIGGECIPMQEARQVIVLHGIRIRARIRASVYIELSNSEVSVTICLIDGDQAP